MSDLHSSSRVSWLQRRGLIAALVIILIAVAFFVVQSLGSSSDEQTEAVAENAVAEELPMLVTLSESQSKSAGLSSALVQRVAMQSTTVVPGRLEYNEERHVSVKSPIDGVVVELKRLPGERVDAGDVLAVVSGPALAQSRALARAALAERKLAESKRRVQADVLSGVQKMIDLIDRGAEPQAIEETVAELTVGDSREKLISAYTRARLAQQMADGSREAASSGAIPQRTQQQRESEWQAADANLKAVKEQAFVEATRLSKEAEAALDSAQRQVEVKMNELRTLLGPASQPISESQIESNSADQYSDVTLVAPMAGTVEERLVAANERVSAGDPIYVVADTSQLWAVAQLRQRDWQAISIQPGTEITIRSPALKDQNYKAEVKIVGRKVDPVTGSMPLTASLTSTDEMLRPGLFIYVELPAGPERNVIAVPGQAIVAHDNQKYVFVATKPEIVNEVSESAESQNPRDQSTYRVQPVVVGDTVAGMTEIKEGLNEGESIVVDGAFTLKSKWLLASEGEE